MFNGVYSLCVICGKWICTNRFNDPLGEILTCSICSVPHWTGKVWSDEEKALYRKHMNKIWIGNEAIQGTNGRSYRKR